MVSLQECFTSPQAWKQWTKQSAGEPSKLWARINAHAFKQFLGGMLAEQRNRTHRESGGMNQQACSSTSHLYVSSGGGVGEQTPQTKQMLSYWATVLDKECTFETDIWSHYLSAFCTLMVPDHIWINSNSLTCHMKASKILLFIWGQSYLLKLLPWCYIGLP